MVVVVLVVLVLLSVLHLRLEPPLGTTNFWLYFPMDLFLEVSSNWVATGCAWGASCLLNALNQQLGQRERHNKDSSTSHTFRSHPNIGADESTVAVALTRLWNGLSSKAGSQTWLEMSRDLKRSYWISEILKLVEKNKNDPWAKMATRVIPLISFSSSLPSSSLPSSFHSTMIFSDDMYRFNAFSDMNFSVPKCQTGLFAKRGQLSLFESAPFGPWQLSLSFLHHDLVVHMFCP